MMWALGIAFIIAASVIWLAPKPTRAVDPAAGGH
jgi:MFS transporter, DHA2 family, multidrug resistance protein